MHLAAYQPDIPQNTGALIRLCASFGVQLELIEPFGFIWDEKKIRVSAMDYYDLVKLTRHSSWEKFQTHFKDQRIILLSTKGSVNYTEFQFRSDDILLLGRESAGVPEQVHNSVSARVKIPLNPEARSINMAMAGGIVLGEALRQTHSFPS
jgi:tRNA (cytidine/uridine-2'-O-)-methyltransferase